MHSVGMTNEQPPEMELLERLRLAPPKLSVSRAASKANLSEGRWRQLAKGYQQANPQTRVPATAPADTLARMAEAVGATPEQLEQVGREDAATEMRATRANLGRGLDKLIPTGPPPAPAEESALAAVRHTLEHTWSAVTDFVDQFVTTHPSAELRQKAQVLTSLIGMQLSDYVIQSAIPPTARDDFLNDLYQARGRVNQQLEDGYDVEVETEPAASAQGKAQEAGLVVGSAVDDAQQRPIADILDTEPGDEDAGVDGGEDGEGRKNLGGQ